jgi:hypothetical protein
MLCRVNLVRTDVSEKLSVTIARVTRIGELGMLALTSNRRKLRRNKKLGFIQPLTNMITKSTKRMFLWSKAAAGE